MDVAISRLKWISIPEFLQQNPELQVSFAAVPLPTEGTAILYDPLEVCRLYARDRNNDPRAYLHLLLHSVFRHFAVSPSILRPQWDLACDMAVEGVINTLDLSALTNAEAAQQQTELGNLMTAEKIYALLRENPPESSEMERLQKLFSPDNHSIWYDQGAVYELAHGYLDGAIKARITPLIEKKNRTGHDYYANIHRVYDWMDAESRKREGQESKTRNKHQEEHNNGQLHH